MAVPPLVEYSLRIVVRARRRGTDSPERRHKVVKSIRDWITRSLGQRSNYVVDACEIREARLIDERDPVPL